MSLRKKVYDKMQEKKQEKKNIWLDGRECIWVEGYKGTYNDMTCRGFQYELNKEHVYTGKVSTGEYGYHFSKDLDDVFKFYSLDGKNRFFKVRALIYKDSYSYGYHEKYAAKKIILTEELGFDDLKKHIIDRYPVVKSEDDWNYVKVNGYNEFKRLYFLDAMKTSGFGEAFINVVFDKCGDEDYYDVINLAHALKEEKISKDMAAYLILRECEY